jgi:hypothetical protein
LFSTAIETTAVNIQKVIAHPVCKEARFQKVGDRKVPCACMNPMYWIAKEAILLAMQAQKA